MNTKGGLTRTHNQMQEMQQKGYVSERPHQGHGTGNQEGASVCNHSGALY